MRAVYADSPDGERAERVASAQAVITPYTISSPEVCPVEGSGVTALMPPAAARTSQPWRYRHQQVYEAVHKGAMKAPKIMIVDAIFCREEKLDKICPAAQSMAPQDMIIPSFPRFFASRAAYAGDISPARTAAFQRSAGVEREASFFAATASRPAKGYCGRYPGIQR